MSEGAPAGGNGPKKKLPAGLKIAALYGGFSMLLTALIVIPIVGVLIVVLNNPFIKFFSGVACAADSFMSTISFGLIHESGVCKLRDEIYAALGQKNVQALRNAAGPGIAEALDCSNASPQAQADKQCIQGLLNSGEASDVAQSPVPPRADWMIPIWESAAKEYKVPWQLLAAVQGARTNFAEIDCNPGDSPGSGQGAGAYAMSSDMWSIDGGFWGKATTKDSASCGTTNKPYKLSKTPTPFHNPGAKTSEPLSSSAGDVFDEVDSTYAEARMLSSLGAGRNWQYSGSASNGCTAPASDGDVYYAPNFAAGSGAVSSKLLTTGQATFASVVASGTGLNPQVVAAWELAEENGAAAQARQALNNNDWLNIGYTDSGQIGTTDNIWGSPTTAGQATAEWLKGQNSIPGYGTASSGIQGILQTVAQSPQQQMMAIANSGWASSHYNNGQNLLATYNELSSAGFKVTALSNVPTHGKKKGQVSAVAYKGKDQTDPTSIAVSTFDSTTSTYLSPCYVAVVHDWYAAIVANPPAGSVDESALRGAITHIAHTQVGHHEIPDGSNSGPEVQPYLQGDPPEAWCADFATWVWRQAGVPGAVHIAGSSAVMEWGIAHHLWHPMGDGYTPQPGDIAVHGAAHTDIVYESLPNSQIVTIDGNWANAVMVVGPYDPATGSPAGEDPITGFVSVPGGGSTKPSGGSGSSSSSSTQVGANGIDVGGVRKAEQYIRSLGGNHRVGFAVVSSDGTTLAQDNDQMDDYGASITKSMLLVAYLQKMQSANLSSLAQAKLAAMIEDSDNASADWVYSQVGAGAVQRVAEQAGMKRFSLNSSDPVYTLGQSQVNSLDFAGFFSQIDQLMPEAHRDYGMRLLDNISSADQWGILSAGISGVGASKAGWKPEGATWVVNQAAQIQTSNGVVGLAITTSGDSSQADGEQILQTIAADLFG